MDGRLDGATLRFGANRAKPPRGWALFTLRSVRRIFPDVHAAGKNDFVLSAGGGNQEGASAPSWTLPGAGGRGPRGPGRRPSSIGGACWPPGTLRWQRKNGILRWQSLALLTKLALHGKLFNNYCPQKACSLLETAAFSGRWLESIFGV